MANLCDVTYRLVGSEEDLKKIDDILTEHEDDAAYISLHNVVDDIFKGISEEYPYGMRADVYSHTQGEIYVEAAWSEMSSLTLRKAIEKAFPEVTVYYLQYEPGMEIYHTNDEYAVEFDESYNFCIDSTIGDYDYAETEKEALSKIRKDIVKYYNDNDVPEFDSIEELKEWFSEYDENECISVYELDRNNNCD